MARQSGRPVFSLLPIYIVIGIDIVIVALYMLDVF